MAMPKEEMRNIANIYNAMTISELQQNYSGVPWLEFINQLLPSEIQVNSDETVVFLSPKYVQSLITLLRNTPKRVQANYAIWRAINDQVPYLNEKFRQKLLSFKHVLIGVNDQQSRWKECVQEVSSSLPLLTSALYVRKYFNEDAKKAAVEMVQYIKETLMNRLRKLDWMDEETRNSALDKATAVVDHVGYPDELLNDTKLEELYETLQVHPEQYLQSHLNINIYKSIFTAKRLRKLVNKTDWIEHGNVAQVNAFYHPLENSIMLPAGILQGSYFNTDRPNFMNYAAIGSVIGHELTHGFDDTGRQFDKDGNLVEWWAPKTKEAFLQKAQCIIEQYGNYTVPEINENLNGINTQGENIADNGGIKQAYLAYNTWVINNGPEPRLPVLNYTSNQLFWISAAMNWCAKYRPEVLTLAIVTDPHSLSEFRVLGPLSNTKYFSKDFNCPLGSKMNPEHKCSVW